MCFINAQRHSCNCNLGSVIAAIVVAVATAAPRFRWAVAHAAESGGCPLLVPRVGVTFWHGLPPDDPTMLPAACCTGSHAQWQSIIVKGARVSDSDFWHFKPPKRLGMSVVGNARQGLASALRNSSLRIVVLSYTDGLRLPPGVELCDARRFERQCELWQPFLEGGIVHRHIPRPFWPHGPMVFFGDMCQLPAPISHGRVAVSCLANKGICLGTFSMHR